MKRRQAGTRAEATMRCGLMGVLPFIECPASCGDRAARRIDGDIPGQGILDRTIDD
jgi:hypothetical protein